MASWAEDAAKLDTPARLAVLSLYRGRRLEGLAPGAALQNVAVTLAHNGVQAILGGRSTEAVQRAQQYAYALNLMAQLLTGESPAMRRLRSL